MAKLHRLCAVLVVLGLAPAARAFDPAYDYANLRAGVFVPQGSSIRGFEAGPDVELAVGRAFLSWISGELAVGYARTGSSVRLMRYHGTAAYDAFDLRERYELVPVTMTVKFVLPAGSIEPWVGGGAGLAWVRISEDPVNGLPTASESHTAFEYHAGGGVSVKLGGRWYAGADLRYAFGKVKWFNEGQVLLDGVRLSAAVGARF